MSNILITGGTGYLGKGLALRLKKEGHSVVVAGRNGSQLFKAEKVTGCKGLALDVASEHSVREVMQLSKPEIVIHAAATKFVDRAELYPMEAVDINVTGSLNVARQAVIAGAKLVVGISTDKASPPIVNTYGMTKSLMERMFCGMDKYQKATRFICCRYGNVAWSTGSVLCHWKQMIEKDGVIRTTGPHMWRFFFTVDDAVQLVLTSMDYALNKESGVVLLREMKSAQLRHVAELMSKKIEPLEGRPGERVDEVLIGETELQWTRSFIDKTTGLRHYVIRFNDSTSAKPGEEPVEKSITSSSAVHLTDAEIKKILDNPPAEIA
jgi:FlaA1/EpsC-like NDP-sugar epimerase